MISHGFLQSRKSDLSQNQIPSHTFSHINYNSGQKRQKERGVEEGGGYLCNAQSNVKVLSERNVIGQITGFVK